MVKFGNGLRAARRLRQVDDRPGYGGSGAGPRRTGAVAALRTGAALLALVALGACADGPFAGGGDDAGAVTPAQSVELVERDVEAPEVFQVTEEGLWDGRPSLGGVWVAHPDVGDPERVIIRNQANGNFVIGALFRRERDNPGPALQVSSDAAEALGMLAGAPVELNVTALRREEAATPAAEEPVAAPGDALAAPPAITADSIEAAPLDPAPVAAAAPTDTAAPSPPAAAPAAAAAPVTASTLERPFIQLGIFSIEANAAGLVDDLTAQGLPARLVESTSQGSAFWRVLVGPAGSEAQRNAYLQQVTAQGFADAYAVRN